MFHLIEYLITHGRANRFTANILTSNLSRKLVYNIIVNHSDVFGASPVGAALTTSSLSTENLALTEWAKSTERLDEVHF